LIAGELSAFDHGSQDVHSGDFSCWHIGVGATWAVDIELLVTVQ
jgi:hypothetical protein